MQTQPLTWGKVRGSAARSLWFNDLSTAGEWSHSNILFRPVLQAPLRLWLTWFWPARVTLKRQPAHHIDMTRVAAPCTSYDPAKDLLNQTRWGRRMTYWGRQGRGVTAWAFWWSAGWSKGWGRAVNATNENVENRFRKHYSCVSGETKWVACSEIPLGHLIFYRSVNLPTYMINSKSSGEIQCCLSYCQIICSFSFWHFTKNIYHIVFKNLPSIIFWHIQRTMCHHVKVQKKFVKPTLTKGGESSGSKKTTKKKQKI